jgi:hypothetical protein
MHHFAGLLPNGTQRDKRPYRKKAGLFPKLTAGGVQQLLTRLGQSLRYGPGAGISALPEGATGMCQK